MSPALVVIGNDLGIGLTGAAGLMSAFSLLAALGGLAAGSAAARAGLRRVLVPALAVLALAGFAAAAATGVVTLYAARLAEGAAFLAVVVAAPALIAQRAAPADRGLALAAWSTFMPAGVCLGLLMAPLVAGPGWRVAWAVASVLPAVAAVTAWAFVRRVPEPAAASGHLPVAALLRARLPVRAALCFATYTVNYVAIAGFLPARLVEADGMSVTAAGLAGAVAAGANVVGNLSAGWAMRAGFGPGWIATLALSAMAVLTAGAFVLPAVPAVVAALLASGIGGMVPASLFAIIPRTVPEAGLTAPALGLTVQCNNIGQFLAPLAIAAAAGFGWGWVVVPLALSAAAFLLTVGPLRRLG